MIHVKLTCTTFSNKRGRVLQFVMLSRIISCLDYVLFSVFRTSFSLFIVDTVIFPADREKKWFETRPLYALRLFNFVFFSTCQKNIYNKRVISLLFQTTNRAKSAFMDRRANLYASLNCTSRDVFQLQTFDA